MSDDCPNETIYDEDQLYRRLHRDHIYEDGSVKRIAYMLDGKPEKEASVDLARLTTAEESVNRKKPGLGLGVIIAREPRTLGFQVEHRPEPSNCSHSQIEGENTRALCKQLAEKTKVIIQPQKVDNTPQGEAAD